MNELKVFRFLKLHGVRRGFIRGTTVCRQLGIPLNKLQEFDYITGVGSIGPAFNKPPKRWQAWGRYARTNGYGADFRFFFMDNVGRPYCLKDRPLRKGCGIPRKQA